LQGRPLRALAGVAAPEAFFAMLEQAGLQLQRQAMPDHSRYEALPWPPGTPDVITTEKDAVKLHAARGGNTRVWVVPLDLALPAALLRDVMALLPAAKPFQP
jgi:tetraacyldisaccharide 4'-kinase